MDFWNQDTEINFFQESLRNFSSPEQLFYKISDGLFAYIPKSKNTEGKTLQSRNSLIDQYTEKWSKDFLSPIASKWKLFSIQGVICPELGLTNSTSADIAFCKTNSIHQSVENIKLIVEIKMSIVNNYSYYPREKKVKFVGDYTTHRSTPSILRSDSMLKAIGKSINIRVSGNKYNKIPIIVLGNSPISKNYVEKVDFLKQAGIIQGFISIHSNPTTESHVRMTPKKGFQTFNDYSELQVFISELVLSNMYFFSSMLSKETLDKLITVATREENNIAKAEKFLQLIGKRK